MDKRTKVSLAEEKEKAKKEADQVDMKQDDDCEDCDDEDEIDTSKVKKEAYQDRDQPAVKTVKQIDDVAPAGKVGDDHEDPYMDGKDPTAKVPAGKVGKSVETPYLKNTAKLAKESVEKMFEGAEGLSEDFTVKATTIFEAAFNSKLKEAVAHVTEEIQADFDAQYAALEEELSEQVDDYLDYVVKEWMEKNEIAIQASIQSEIAENFLADFKDLFERHNITIPEHKIDLLESAHMELEEIKEQVNALTEANIEKTKTIFEFEKAQAISKLSEGLAATQVEKLKTLVEDIDAKDISTFKQKAKIICESFLGKDATDKALNEGEEIVLSEDTDENKADKKTSKVNPAVSRYVEAARRQKW